MNHISLDLICISNLLLNSLNSFIHNDIFNTLILSTLLSNGNVLAQIFINCCLDNLHSFLTDFLFYKFQSKPILIPKWLSRNTNLIYIPWSRTCNGFLVHSELSSSTYLGNTNIQRPIFAALFQMIKFYNHLFTTWTSSNAFFADSLGQ